MANPGLIKAQYGARVEALVDALNRGDELNLKEIGAVLKVTESRVCQLHGQALTRLKARLAGWSDANGGGKGP